MLRVGVSLAVRAGKLCLKVARSPSSSSTGPTLPLLMPHKEYESHHNRMSPTRLNIFLTMKDARLFFSELARKMPTPISIMRAPHEGLSFITALICGWDCEEGWIVDWVLWWESTTLEELIWMVWS